MNEEKDLNKLLPFITEDKYQAYMDNNNISNENNAFLDNCVEIFLTLCNYQRIDYMATSYTAFNKKYPFPIIFYYNLSIITIYEKQIFDATNKSPIKVNDKNIKKYITTPCNENGTFSLKYWVLSQDASDSKSSSNNKSSEDIPISDNSTTNIKSKTITKSPKHSISITTTNKETI